MDAIRVSKVQQVACTKAGTTIIGTIHLTAHHLIFRYDADDAEEMWVPYPLISSVVCLPQTAQGRYPVTFHTRTFETFSFGFSTGSESMDVFESIKELTVATSIAQLYAFFYSPNPSFPSNAGWSIYSPREEFGRMGVGTRSKAWRFTDINKDYSFCSTYPARLVVPTRISDATLQYASKYRSKCRIPILSYLHWANYGSITRSSQPMVGITQNRSIQDEKLVEAIFHSHLSPDSRVASVTVYGATATNLIIDARPTANAVANTAKGAGTENMDHYRDGKKAYLGIDNIHTMRDSLIKMVEALREADAVLASINNDLSGQFSGLSVLDRGALRRSGWLRHISAILEGTLLITRNIHVNSSHVLIHCSDGWDRTSQLSALSQLCLDPFYRTIRGFQTLIEKDWLSMGHRFLDRCGHLSSDKFFLSSSDGAPSTSGADAAQAFFASVQNRFASHHHLKEISPVFHQFLESVRQVQRQHPRRFEFNERFLRQLYYHLYSCQFGTFLFNSERDRRLDDGGQPPCERTLSVWDFFNALEELEQNRNPDYDPSLDEPTRRDSGADMGVLFPNPKDVRFWHELYGRTDEEMNGRVPNSTRGISVALGVVDSAQDDLELPKSPPSPSETSRPHTAHPESSKLGSTNISQRPRDLSASMPEVSLTSTNQGNNERTQVTTLDTPQPTRASPGPQSPSRPRTRPPDFLSSASMMSVWGKFSSNASAAFSAVQDAYAGVAKDLRSVAQGASDEASKTAELRDRESLSTWGEEATPSSAIRRPLQSLSLADDNPWIASASKSSNTGLEHNPWASPTLHNAYHQGSGSDSSPLPKDPNISDPRCLVIPSPERTSPMPEGTDQIKSFGHDSLDPLGVGSLQ